MDLIMFRIQNWCLPGECWSFEVRGAGVGQSSRIFQNSLQVCYVRLGFNTNVSAGVDLSLQVSELVHLSTSSLF